MIYLDFINQQTTQTAKALLGVKIIYQDEAAHGFGGKITPKVTSLYKKGGTIYAHVMHTHLLINFVTRTEGIPEGVLIRAIEPDEGIGAMNVNRGKSGYELTNGPGKWTKAFNIPRSIDGSTLNDCKLSIDTNHRKYPKTIVESGRIGIPNKGEWTNKPLRFTVKGNPYVSRMRKSDFQNPDDTWK